MTLTRSLMAAPLAAVLAAGLIAAPGPDEGRPQSAAEFDKLHAMLEPQPGESRWMEVAWHPSVWEGRKKAAAEGKPMLLWAGSGSAPAAGC
jgi:hypothetical protein